MKEKTKYRFLFAGGGTGGHLFPAVAVAEKIREKLPESEILFIGTKNKIEGTVVPKLGFKFKSIWVKGLTRGSIVQNLLFPVKLMVSTVQSLFINISFQPRVAIGSGGYVAGPAIYAAYLSGAKVMLLESNSYPGVTTRLLEKYAAEVHIAFDEARKYLKNKNKLFLTGNPVRNSLSKSSREYALKSFRLDSSKKTLLVLGGSLGARTINRAMAAAIPFIKEKGIQVIWQTGKNYFEEYDRLSSDGVVIKAFIEDMNAAYASCDLLVSRAGATTIAEITSLGIPAVLVPSPNVAENHQYHNAKYLTDSGAAVLVEDKHAEDSLANTVISLISDDEKIKMFSEKALKLGKINAAEEIAERAIKMAEEQ